MVSYKKLLLWAAMLISLVLSGYAITSAMFKAWLSTVQPQSLAPEVAEYWFWGLTAASLLFLATFFYFVFRLKKLQ